MKTRLLTALCLALAVTACTTAGDSMDSSDPSLSYVPEMQTAPELRIKDLPLPNGFNYKPEKSMILEYGNTVAGILLCEGPGDPAEVISFFRREMPKFDWTMSNMIERRETRMIFEKQGKTCELSVYPSGLSKRTAVYVYYAPKQ